MKVAVIGVGSMGRNHARVYMESDDVELVAVADAHQESVEKVAQRFNTKGYTDYKEMLRREEIDAVSIVVPTKLHKQVALDVILSGKHLLLEKPIAYSEEESIEIIEAARIAGVKLMIGHIERFNPAVQELKKRLSDLGEIYKIDVHRIGPFPSRVSDVGVIIDLSVHDLDIIHYLLGTHPSRVFAETQQKLHPTHEDSVTALLKYGNKITATLNINYLSPTKIRELQIFGKKGMFKVNYLEQELYFYENAGFAGDSWDSVVEGDMHKIAIQKKEPLAEEIKEFLRCIREDTVEPVTGEMGIEVLAVARLLEKSSEENCIIFIEDDNEEHCQDRCCKDDECGDKESCCGECEEEREESTTKGDL